MKNYTRLDRINELLKREIADMMERLDFQLENCLVTVSQVEASPDLRHAKVYISILGKKQESMKGKILHFLSRNKHHLQTKIAKDIVLKNTPVLEFIVDERIEEGDRVLQIISDLENKGK
ncbi:MAG TPA: 30S ribosome-binding factor RbfA [Lentisphaeria bacterium]|nr:MAG: ribosome-binding factor A [Lentisphaerae bacterium GWF2_49_21]HBC86317.1 30S ribosome-binding factor RbfA [Lentisphaeria bacterium]